ncbi:MAG: FMN-binding negative transcriptional regulator [Candidatus Eisenbacteria bacterium]
MYLPRRYEVTDLGTLHEFVREHPLGAWIRQQDGELVADHIPFLLEPSKGEFGTLYGHVARANPAWKALAPDRPSLVLFQGADAYVTPTWYPGKSEHGRVVPTWNYAVVHATGVARAIDDAEWLREHVGRMTDTQERNEALPWRVSDAPEEYVRKMVEGIVGVEIPLTRLVGKWKVSQNRDDADRAGVIAGLTGRGDDASRAMAAMVRAHAPRGPEDAEPPLT